MNELKRVTNPKVSVSEGIKLNLGCGSKILEGYINVDKFDYYNVDRVHDLEKFPYPFKDDTVNEIILSHVLEHIGQNPDTFNGILKEIYRICKNQAIIHIAVPHPRHDDFIADPTHVRPITVLGLSLYNKELNEEWAKKGAANTPLGLIHDVDFRISEVNYVIDDEIMTKHQNGELDRLQLDFYMKHYNNVIKQINIKWIVNKNN